MSIPNISALLDQHLLAKRDAEPDRAISGGATWRASKLGSCLRQQYLEFCLKQPKLDEFSAQTLRRFEVGHQWGRQFAVWLADLGFEVQEEVELHDADLDIGAHVDFIITKDGQTTGIELKSVNSAWFSYRDKAKETTASPENMMQAACYDILSRKQGRAHPWIVLTCSKDDLRMNQDEVTQAHRDLAEQTLRQLNAAKISGKPPECTCLDGWVWKYCGFYEGDKMAAKKKGAKPEPGAKCCQILQPAWL